MHSKVRISYIFPSNLYSWNKFSDSIFSFFFFFIPRNSFTKQPSAGNTYLEVFEKGSYTLL